MSTAIPLHFLLTSYSDEKLIQAEKDQYQKLIDYSEVFISRLKNNIITEFDYPFYREYVNDVTHEYHNIREIMYKRNIQLQKRDMAKHVIAIHDQVIISGFKWVISCNQ